MPAAANGSRYTADNFAIAREIATWKGELAQRWQALHLEAALSSGGQLTVGEALNVRAKLWLNGIDETQVAVELIAGTQNGHGELLDPITMPMQTVNRENGALIYEGSLTPDDSGILTLGVCALVPCTKH
ncbi:MAG: hypothetical protein R2932_22450 [Caldilineaceae bacterium]